MDNCPACERRFEGINDFPIVYITSVSIIKPQDVPKAVPNWYHEDMLEKLNKAGELIVNWENFYESSLSELEDIIKFVEILSKRPAVSSDPDFANFVRAVQLMTQIIEKYSDVSRELKRGGMNIKSD